MSSYSENPIWRALAVMRIEPDGAALTFVGRLARENRWRMAHAETVMHEYRRFLFLVATAPHPVTPSDDVDRAWHLHLAYSRHYWDELCARVLGRPLHHGPTEGGPVEDVRYHAQYDATLAFYIATFGEHPPVSIWPSAADRFAARPIWVDSARYWTVPKAIGARAALAGGTALLAACSAYAATGSSDETGTIVGWVIFGAFVMFAIVTAVASHNGRRGTRRRRSSNDGGCGSDGGGSGCSSDSSDSSSDSGSGCGGGGCGGGGD